MQIQQAILHRIEKEKNTSGTGSAIPVTRTSQLPIDGRLEKMTEEILKIYGKSTNGYGTFNANQTLYQFPVKLKDYVLQSTDFIQFTIDTTDLISLKMAGEAFSTGGYVLILRYTNLGQDWLMVAMLKLKHGTGINEQTMDLSDTLSFDIDHLHEAARVDLAKWQSNTQPYLSFVKKRQTTSEVSKYFREALGCTEYTDSKHQTIQIKKAFEDYCEANSWSSEKKRTGRQQFYEHCDAKDKSGEPVNLAALSAILDDQNPTSFSEFVRDNDYQVNDTFKPDRATFSKLNRISKSFGSVKVSFEVQDIDNGKVAYDPDNRCLVIRDLPSELIDEINKHKSSDATTTA
ncbi:Nucleoid-associated protein YejK [Ferriphaselus amnicola]|uniref:Nucleoid-associated protein YejK n=1 Tax=Ferriphaselus amnicola TaxID=1188319 RepID=A0A2Z6GCT8_9PROT|nr:nucleoid-associated protein [Ferriphaselus amnicola]BBE51194.1 Nucleoid-associated protein YejK [Ferriphaselus amnicola]